MKICFLSMEYPPYPSYISPGGVGTHTFYLSKFLARRGHEVHVITCADHQYYELINDVHVHRIKSIPSSAVRVLLYSMKASKKLHALNKSVKFDIVHDQSPYGFFEAYSHEVNKQFNLVTTIHAVPLREMVNYEQAHRTALRNLAETLSLIIPQILFNKVEYAESCKIITVSHNNRSDLIELFNMPKEKITVIHNGVDIERFNPNADGQKIKEQFGLGASKIVLYVGRLERHKGLYLLLEVARKIIEEEMDVHFIVVGSGRHEIELAKIGKKMGRRVIFAGRVSDELLPLYYSAADVVALPSLYEGGPPLTLLEAMASAKPVITTNIPPITELVDNSSAVIINPGEKELFVKKITDLLLDEEHRRILGNKARSKVLECFTWEKVAEETEKVYKEVVNEE